MRAKAQTPWTLSTTSALPTCLRYPPTRLRALPTRRATATTPSSQRSISSMGAATLGRAASTLRQTTLMALLCSTTSTARLLADKPTPKAVSAPTRLCTCLTTIGCKRSAKHTTTRGTRASLQRISKSRTRRKGSRYRSRWHEARSEMRPSAQPREARATQRHLIRCSSSTRPSSMGKPRWPTLAPRSSPWLASNRVATNSSGHCNQVP